MFNKKNLLSLPVIRHKSVTNLFRSADNITVVAFPQITTLDGKRLLIIDFFTREYVIRSFIHKSKGVIDDFISYDYRAKTWSKTNIINKKVREQFDSGMGYDWFLDSKSFAFIKREVVFKFFGLGKDQEGISNWSLLNLIDRQMCDVKDRRRVEKARKIERIMNKVPPLSPAQEKWIRDHYLEFRNETRNVLYVSKNYRFIFPFFITKVDGIPIVRHFKATVNLRTKELHYYEFCRDVYDGKTVKSYEPKRLYSENSWKVLYEGWLPGRVWEHKRYGAGPLYTANLKSVIKNTVFQYSGIIEYYNSCGDIPIEHWDHYLKAQQAMPQLEYVVKEGLSNLASEISYDYFWRNINPYKFYNAPSNASGKIAALNPKALTTLEFLGINKKLFELFKEYKNSFGMDELMFLQEYYEYGICLTKDALLALIRVNTVNSFTAKSIIEIAHQSVFSADKLMRYLSKQTIDKDCCETDKAYYNELEQTSSLYIDYIDFCKELGYDLSQTVISFPKDLQIAHDKASDAIEVKQNRDLYQSFKALTRALKPLDNMVIGNYIFKFPKTKSSFVRQGQSLKQCVGNGTYYKTMAEQQRLIVFVNKADDPDTPFLTLDIKNGAEIQFRGYKNGIVTNGGTPTPEDAKLAAKHYLRLINRAITYSDSSIKVNQKEAEKISKAVSYAVA